MSSRWAFTISSTYDDYVYQTVNGITFGYLSYTEHTNGLPTPSGAEYGVVYLDDRETIAKQIADMRPNCDVLIVSAHMGTEGTHEINDFQKQTAQWLADQGVDVIIGTHPHVVQNVEWLTGANGNTTFVVYSLGNFINAQSSADNTIGAILDVYFDKTTQPDGSSSITIRDPKLHCVISQYEAGYKNIRVIPYSQYTDELAQPTACLPSPAHTLKVYFTVRLMSSLLRWINILHRKDDCLCTVSAKSTVNRTSCSPPFPVRSTAPKAWPSIWTCSPRQALWWDMICQSAPRGAAVDFSFTTSYDNFAAVMKALPAAAKANPPLVSGGYSKINLFGEEMVTSCGVAARALAALSGANVEIVLITTSDLDISLLIRQQDEDAALEALHKAFAV